MSQPPAIAGGACSPVKARQLNFMPTRRDFLKTAVVTGLSVPLARSSFLLPWPAPAASIAAPLLQPFAGETLITILHTNDPHSQIDPLPANDKSYPNKGGVSRVAPHRPYLDSSYRWQAADQSASEYRLCAGL